MPTDELTAFVKVVESGGFSAAAPALQLTPSAVSKLIARLEERLGVRLLQRTTRQVRCTPEGEAYYQRVSRLLADLQASEQELTEGSVTPRGLLRVTTSVAIGMHQLAPLVPEFLERYPALRLDLTVDDRVNDLVAEGFDLAVRLGRAADSSLKARKIGDAHRYVYAAPSYLERHGTPRLPDDLLKHNCLNFSGQNVLNRWPFHAADRTRLSELEVRGNFLGNNGELLFQMALAGVGLMRLADLVAAGPEREGKLVRVLARYDPGDSIPLYAVWPQGRFVAPKVRVFVDYLVEKLAPAPRRRR
jgi:DNA-binding transcriptional LysR family regulator